MSTEDLFATVGLEETWILDTTHLVAVILFLILWKTHQIFAQSQEEVFHDAVASVPESIRSDDEWENLVDFNALVPEEDDLWLRVELPESTAEERARFYIAQKRRRVETAKAMKPFLTWNSDVCEAVESLDFEPTGDKDLDDWTIASMAAMKLRKERKQGRVLPRVARMLEVEGNGLRDLKDTRVVFVLPGMHDERIADPATYALALGIYLGRRVPRNSTEKITIVLDVRGGVGWRNLNAVQQMPFIQQTSKLMLSMYPERLRRAIVYPVPSSLTWLWQMASRWIEPVTREKFGLVSGPATVHSPQPTADLLQFLDEVSARTLEESRTASFQSSCDSK